MTNFIPIFPLSIVVYPGEDLNLHIFEPRYKQLIQEAVQTKKPFGIPTVIDNHVGELGTLVEVVEITNTYDNGEMDIKTKALAIFRILELVKSIPDKLYSGAIVNYPDNELRTGKSQMKAIMENIRHLHQLLDIQKDFKKAEADLMSYDVAHHAGLTLQQELDILGLFREDQRQEYLKRELNKMLPFIAEMENLKTKVKLNGHFKHLTGLDFE
jgi:uncharacterized protein